MISLRHLIALIAFVDGSLPLAYALGLEPAVLQATGLALKIGVLLMHPQPHLSNATVSLLGLGTALLSVSLLVEAGDDFAAIEYLRYGAVFATLALMLVIVPATQFSVYGATFFLTSVGCAALHLALVAAGSIPDHFGRSLYLGGNHPNLGGEIYAVATLLGALSLRRGAFLAGAAVLFAGLYVMQSRAAELVVLGTVLIKLFLERGGMISARSTIVGCGVLLAAAFLLLLEGSVPRLFLTRILLVDDTFRGIGTGLVGRDQRWQLAWGVFAAHPFLGAGISHFQREGLPMPHNAFLYGLALHGVLSLAFWAFFGAQMRAVLRRSATAFVYLLPPLLLLVLNDRFVNMNTYPLIYYFAVIKLAERRLE